jgi:hypothetical protein
MKNRPGCCVEGKESVVKGWEVIADNLKKADWSLGYVSAIDSNGRTIWIADANRDDGKRFVVHADEKLTAFLELESAIRHQSIKSKRIARSRSGHVGPRSKKEIALKIAHVLFIDIVGYSKLSINEQHAAVDELRQMLPCNH